MYGSRFVLSPIAKTTVLFTFGLLLTATGPGQQGCLTPCKDQPFGCCQDNITPAHGPNKEGCCLLETYGCCPDNVLTAQGPNLEGRVFTDSPCFTDNLN